MTDEPEQPQHINRWLLGLAVIVVFVSLVVGVMWFVYNSLQPIQNPPTPTQTPTTQPTVPTY